MEISQTNEDSRILKYNLADFDDFKNLLLNEDKPSKVFETARKLGIIDRRFPWLAELLVTEQDPEWHREGSVWEHAMQALDAAAEIADRENLGSQDRLVLLLAVLCHDLGKSTTTREETKDNGKIRLTAKKHDVVGASMVRELIAFFDKDARVISDETTGDYKGVETDFEELLVRQVSALIKAHMQPRSIYKRFLKENRNRKSTKKLVKTMSESGTSMKMLLMVVEADERGRNDKGEGPLKLDQTGGLQEMLDWFRDGYLS